MEYLWSSKEVGASFEMVSEAAEDKCADSTGHIRRNSPGPISVVLISQTGIRTATGQYSQ